MIEQLKGRRGCAQGHDLSMISRCYECLRAEQWTQRGVSPELIVWPEGFSFRENGFQLHDHHSNPLLGITARTHNHFTTQRVRVWESNNCKASFFASLTSVKPRNSSLHGKRDYKSNFWYCMLNYKDLHWRTPSHSFRTHNFIVILISVWPKLIETNAFLIFEYCHDQGFSMCSSSECFALYVILYGKYQHFYSRVRCN